jgi:hypothetical protein
MKKFTYFMLAASFFCASALTETSCSKDKNDDKPVPEEQKPEEQKPEEQKPEDQKPDNPQTEDTTSVKPDDPDVKVDGAEVFVKHFRSSMQTIAENLNFYSWGAMNIFNGNLMTNVLSSAYFNSALREIIGKAVENTVEPAGDDVAAQGFKYQAFIDWSAFDYNFVFKDDGSGIDVTPAENFSITVPYNSNGKTVHHVWSMKSDGGKVKVFAKHMSDAEKSVGVVLLCPEKLSLSIASDGLGSMHELMKCNLNFSVKRDGIIPNILTSDWHVSGDLTSAILAGPNGVGDAMSLKFEFDQNPSSNQTAGKFSFVHNGKPMIDFDLTITDTEHISGIFSHFTPQSDASIFDVIYLMVAGQSVDNCKITLADDLTAVMQISDCKKAVELWQKAKTARRSYASQEEIETYTQELNKLMTLGLECKATDAKYSMILETTEVGIDYIPMPALKFNEVYIPLTALADQESMEYAVNIIDHSLDNIQQTIIVARQALGLFMSIIGGQR